MVYGTKVNIRKIDEDTLVKNIHQANLEINLMDINIYLMLTVLNSILSLL